MVYTTDRLRSDLKHLGPAEFTKRIEQELAIQIENVTDTPRYGTICRISLHESAVHMP